VRNQNWDILLAEFITSRHDTPFEWGVHDCTLFAVDAGIEIMGVDLAADYRGRYSDESGAARIIAEAGSLRALVGRHAAEINPKMAQRGDWVMVEQCGADALAVCIGTRYIAAGVRGLACGPMSDAVAAWRIE
jgi:hypothetical protein